MKKLTLVLVIAMLFLNCDSRTTEKPKNLIEKEVMVDILYDLYLINALKSNDVKFSARGVTPAKFIYEKYKIDSLQFLQSDIYYASDLEEYEKLYQKVTQKLQEDKAVIDTLIARNPVKEPKIDSKTPVVTPFRVKDSLRAKRKILTGYKDSIRN